MLSAAKRSRSILYLDASIGLRSCIKGPTAGCPTEIVHGQKEQTRQNPSPGKGRWVAPVESPPVPAGLFPRPEPAVLLRISPVGQDRLWHGRGHGLPQGRGPELLGQGADGGPADVGSQDGRLPPVRGHSSPILPGLRLVFFYDLSAVYRLALHPDDVRRWPWVCTRTCAKSTWAVAPRCGAE